MALMSINQKFLFFSHKKSTYIIRHLLFSFVKGGKKSHIMNIIFKHGSIQNFSHLTLLTICSHC